MERYDFSLPKRGITKFIFILPNDTFGHMQAVGRPRSMQLAGVLRRRAGHFVGLVSCAVLAGNKRTLQAANV